MSPVPDSMPPEVRRFRTKLFVSMMLVISALTLSGLYFAQWRGDRDAEADAQLAFDAELRSLESQQKARVAAAEQRCGKLVKHPRIRGALEDDPDRLYPDAEVELEDLMKRALNPATPRDVLQAKFYRFLNSEGRVIATPTKVSAAGEAIWPAGFLEPNEEAQLTLPTLPQTPQEGYLVRMNGRVVDEMIAVPIRWSGNDAEVIAALVLGIKPAEVIAGSEVRMLSGILVNRELRLPAVAQSEESRLRDEVLKALVHSRKGESNLSHTTLGGVPHLLFVESLNKGSIYPPAYEVCLYPLTQSIDRQRTLRWQILAAGAALLLGGFVVSNMISRRLSQPVEQLAVISEKEHAQRRRAEAALQSTSEELQRTARFSADASHQLKSPITVLRAGLDSLLAREDLPPEVYEEIDLLIHQTYRLTGVVEDLLLLSRMDAGRLQLNLKTVNLTFLVEEWLDDLRTVPDAADLRVESNLPEDLQIAGEQKYTSLVVQNLLDNARKYNCPGGIIRITGAEENGRVALSIANTGYIIPPEAQPYIFERFRRVGAGDVPGHGLGLNLARDLVRLHGGELRLVRSSDGWTEFRVIFLAAKSVPAVALAAG